MILLRAGLAADPGRDAAGAVADTLAGIASVLDHPGNADAH